MHTAVVWAVQQSDCSLAAIRHTINRLQGSCEEARMSALQHEPPFFSSNRPFIHFTEIYLAHGAWSQGCNVALPWWGKAVCHAWMRQPVVNRWRVCGDRRTCTLEGGRGVLCTARCLSVSLQSSSEVGGGAGVRFFSANRIFLNPFIRDLFIIYFSPVENSIKAVTKPIHSKHNMFS